MLISSGWRADVSIQTAVVAVILCAIGWIYGLRLTRHPLAQDVFGALDALLSNSIATRVLAARVRLFGGWR
jgi:type IV secretory pathway VirB2 component (pilin)